MVDALQSEVAVRPIYEGVPELTQSLARIRALGFEPRSVFPNNEGHFRGCWNSTCTSCPEAHAASIERRGLKPAIIPQVGAAAD